MFENEPNTIGCTDRTKVKLERLKDEGYFNEMMDAYKFAVSYALASNAISDPLSKTGTIFNVGSIDRDRLLYDAVKALRPNSDEPVYKTIERLAEWGINELAADADSGDINFGAIFERIQNKVKENGE